MSNEPRMSNETPSELLSVRGLSIDFTMYGQGLKRKVLHPIKSLDVSVNNGEMLAIIGASGSGKSLLAHALLGVLPANATCSGTVTFKGERLTYKQLAAKRGTEMALVPQGINSLNPLMKVGQAVRECAKLAGCADPVKAQREAFKRYELEQHVEKLYPFEISGGMARRVLVSTAAVGKAELIVADEPTPGLQSELVIETLTHLRELADQGRAVIVITHDIEAAVKVADRVSVFHSGRSLITEKASAFSGDGSQLIHPYSKMLWKALPDRGFEPIDDELVLEAINDFDKAAMQDKLPKSLYRNGEITSAAATTAAQKLVETE